MSHRIRLAAVAITPLLALLAIAPAAHASTATYAYTGGSVVITDAPNPVRVLTYQVTNPACHAGDGFSAQCAPQSKLSEVTVPAGDSTTAINLPCGVLVQIDVTRDVAQPATLTYPAGSNGFLWWPGSIIGTPDCSTGTPTPTGNPTSPEPSSTAPSSTTAPPSGSTTVPPTSPPPTSAAPSTSAPARTTASISHAAPSRTRQTASTARISLAPALHVSRNTPLATTGSDNVELGIIGTLAILVGGLILAGTRRNGDHS